jgi:hypothetical protein
MRPAKRTETECEENTLQTDLESRARAQTLAELDRQGRQYDQFNREVLAMVQPDEERRKLEEKILTAEELNVEEVRKES